MRTSIENPVPGDTICVYLERGWVEINCNSFNVTIAVFDDADEEVHGVIIPYEKLTGETK